MNFVKENGRTIPVADKVFALSGRAKAAIAARAKVLITFFIISGIFYKDIQKAGHTEMAGFGLCF